MGVRNGWAANTHSIGLGDVGFQRSETDVLVVGSGIAGLFAAVKADEAGAGVLMISRDHLGTSGQTPFARGIFAWDPLNSPMRFLCLP